MAHVDPMERVISVVAFASTMVAVIALHFSPMTMRPEPPPPEPQQVTVSVTLEAAPPPEAPAPPADVPPPPPPPAKEIQPDRPIVPVQKREPPKPRPPTPPKPEQTIAKPVETPTPPPPAAVAPVAAPKPVAPVANTASEEAGYVGRLRGYIRSITQYPTSGQARRERPEGSTEVRFTLNRAGQIQDAAIEQSSGSPILDKQALSIVKGGAYPAMPADAWADASEHVFTVTVVFTAP